MTDLREQVCQYRDELQRGADRTKDNRILSAAFRGVADRLNRILLTAPVAESDPSDSERDLASKAGPGFDALDRPDPNDVCPTCGYSPEELEDAAHPNDCPDPWHTDPFHTGSVVGDTGS